MIGFEFDSVPKRKARKSMEQDALVTILMVD